MRDQLTQPEGKVYTYTLQIINQKTLITLLAPLESKKAREVSKHLNRCYVAKGVPHMLHIKDGGEFTRTVLLTELRGFFPSLRITT
jgi:hypothetical protein